VECNEDDWTHLCAKDEQHTLWDDTAVSIVGTEYQADTTLTLEGGDTDNDGDVDIHDVTFFLYDWATADPYSCAWDGTRGADFSNDGNVGAEDYTFLTSNWHMTSSCPCSWMLSEGMIVQAQALPLHSSLRVNRLDPQIAAQVDLNADGIVDYQDVEIFETQQGLPHALSTMMQASSEAPPMQRKGPSVK
jgi:hypothetical protein